MRYNRISGVRDASKFGNPQAWRDCLARKISFGFDRRSGFILDLSKKLQVNQSCEGLSIFGCCSDFVTLRNLIELLSSVRLGL